ncbi:hypothetical protein C2S53_008048 [Perilla frutescens var. hirtella]|uniref:Phosphoinositide phospholipase C n=1 Tax=Perilla frutescens var. hirtella TaxID=608512 RepID=A0AAD4NZA1_PERFH|nr:hypothetical protein C2S53_008048 [Perilla frutescens var. hirtella]
MADFSHLKVVTMSSQHFPATEDSINGAKEKTTAEVIPILYGILKDPSSSSEAIKIKEVMITDLSDRLREEGRAEELQSLLTKLQPFFSLIPKAKTTKLICGIIDSVAKILRTSAEIKELFESYSENGLMNVDHLLRFLKEVQGEEEITRDEAEAVMESFLNEHKHLNIFHRRSLYIKEFFWFLLSGINAPLSFPPKKPQEDIFADNFIVQVHQDMNFPLSHYFIYTGHNSYLTGNQISGDSSEVPRVAHCTCSYCIICTILRPAS